MVAEMTGEGPRLVHVLGNIPRKTFTDNRIRRELPPNQDPDPDCVNDFIKERLARERLARLGL